MKSIAIFVVCLAFAFGLVLGQSSSGAGCTVALRTTARSGGSYQSGSGVSQIYDIVVTNNGRCSVDKILLDITLASGMIMDKFNLEPENGHYRVTSFEPTLPVGNSVNAGIIVNYPNTQTVPANAVTVTVFQTLCPSSCVGNGGASTSASSASATTGAAQTATTSSVPPASTTSAGGAASSGGSTSTNNGACMARVVLTQRAGGSYMSGNDISQIYDATVINSGTCGLTNIVLQLGIPSNSAITETFNLQSNGNLRYTVTSYEGFLPPGNSVNTGFVVRFTNMRTVPTGVSAIVYSNTCPASCASQGSTAAASATTGGATTASAANTGGATSTASPAVTSSAATAATGGATTGTQQPSSCMVTSTLTRRTGPMSSYQSGSGVDQIYDLTVTNNGACTVNNIVVQVSLPGNGAFVESTFNLASNGNMRYTVTNYGGQLQTGRTANAGIIVNFPNTQTVPAGGVSATVVDTTCPQC